jgi:hypothetical protein
MIKKKPFWALLAVGMTVVATDIVSAQSIVPRVGMLGEFKTKSLVGSWQETFTFLDGPQKGRVGTSLGNYNSDGTLVGSEAGSIMFDPPPKHQKDPQTGLVTSDDIGAWTQLDWHTFAYTSHSLFSDFSGNLVGSLKVTGKYTLSISGDGYNGYSFYEGTISGMAISGYVSNVGVRLSVESPPPQQP